MANKKENVYKPKPTYRDQREREQQILAGSTKRSENRGVKNIMIICSDGLTGIGDAITAAFPNTEQQRCIVHMVRNMCHTRARRHLPVI